MKKTAVLALLNHRLRTSDVISRNMYHAMLHWYYRLTALLQPKRKPNADGYVIFHLGRVGSTALTNMLKQNPNIAARGEILESHISLRNSRHWTRWLCPNAGFLSALIQLMRRNRHRQAQLNPEGCPAYGFEFLNRDVVFMGWTIEQAVEFFKRRGFGHFVFLQRRNVLRLDASVRVASSRGKWHLPKQEALPPHRITISLDENFVPHLDGLHQYNTRMLDHLNEARQRGERWLHLVYEDDIEQSPKVAYEKVCEFLGVEAVEAECPQQRLNPQPLSEIIENFDEVREHLRGTRYEAMLED